MQRPTDGRSQFCIPNSSPTAAPRPHFFFLAIIVGGAPVLNTRRGRSARTSSSPRRHSSPCDQQALVPRTGRRQQPGAPGDANLKPQGLRGLPAASGSRWTRAAPSQPPGYEARRPAPPGPAPGVLPEGKLGAEGGARGQRSGGKPGSRARTSPKAPRTPCLPAPLPRGAPHSPPLLTLQRKTLHVRRTRTRAGKAAEGPRAGAQGRGMRRRPSD